MQRGTQGSNFGPQQAAPPMAPHPVAGGPMHHGSYQQGSHSYGQYQGTTCCEPDGDAAQLLHV